MNVTIMALISDASVPAPKKDMILLSFRPTTSRISEKFSGHFFKIIWIKGQIFESALMLSTLFSIALIITSIVCGSSVNVDFILSRITLYL